jgi:TRAP-type mannitol/chloroaromatic compound transport system substrate-binding protein
MQALDRLRAKGVNVKQWDPAMIKQLKQMWTEEAKRLAATDPNFKKIWDSQQSFRQQHEKMKELQRLP